MKKSLLSLIIVLLAFAPAISFGQASGHSTTAAYITTDSEPWGQQSNIQALNSVYGSTGWNKYIYGTDANGNVSNIFSNTRSLVFIEGGNYNTTAMKNFLDANWSTIQTWISGGRTLIVNAATNESIGKFQIGASGLYSERILTNNMRAFSSSATYPNTTSNVHPLLRTNVTINGVTGDAYFSGDYYGNYVAHNVITGTGNPIFYVSTNSSQYTLVEKTYGSGRMLVGGLTLPWFITVTSWQPQPQMTRFMYAMLGWVQAVSNPAPTINTTAYSNLTTTSVSTGGNTINANGETITAKGVAYATTQNPTTSNSVVSGGSGNANFSVNITGLSPNTLYYARAYATSPTGTGYGSQISFRTLPINPSNATSSAANNTICSGSFTNLSVSNAQGTVYWYTDANRTNFVGTGNPRSVNPSTTTTYYAWNYNGEFSTGSTSVTITVNQPASQPATASVTVPAGADGLTKANLSWAASSGDGTITYEWAVGPSSTVNYDAGYTSRGTTTNLTAQATGLTQSTGYYLAVRAKNGCGTSINRVSPIFRTNNQRTYVAGSNGTVGTTAAGGNASEVQYTAYNTNGTAIHAIPNLGYNFVNWSDGITANPRTDHNVTTSATLTANFAPNRLAFASQPTNSRAGVGQTITIEITDTYGNRMTNSTAAVTLSFQNNPSIGGLGKFSGTESSITVNAVAGLATFSNVWINKTGNGYTLKASSPTPIVTEPISSSFNIIPALEVNYFTLIGIVTPHEAGTFTSPTVTAYDVYDNIKYDYTGTVSFSTNNASLNLAKPTLLPANYTFTIGDNGVKTFTNQVNLKQYGSGYYVRVNDGAAQGEQTGIHVSSAPLNFYTIVANADGNGVQQDVLAGTSFSVLAKLYDEYSNMKVDFNGNLDITFTTTAIPSPLGNPPVIPAAGNRTFTAGVTTIPGFTFFNAQETPTITVIESLTASSGTTPPITVWPEALHNFLVQKDPLCVHTIGGVRVTADDNFSVKVTARDRYNNIKRDYIGNINFKSSNDNIVIYPTGLQDFNSGHQGIRNFSNIRIPITGSYWLRVADSPDAFKTGTLENIIVAPGVQNSSNSELFFTSHPSSTTYPSTPAVTAGDFISVTIRPRDAGSNLLCDCQNVRVFLNGIDTHRNGATIDGIPSMVTIPVTDNHDGSYTALVRVTDMSQINQITASIHGTQIHTILYLDITQPSPPAYYVITGNPSQTAGTTQNITIRVFDEFANLATQYDGEKLLRFSGANASYAPSTNPIVSATEFGNNTSVTFANGVATMSMTLYRAEVAVIAATEINGGTAGQSNGTAGITTPVDIIGARIYRLTVNVSPNNIYYFAVTGNGTQIAGDNQTITVTAYDQWNNIATGYTGDQSITFSGAADSPNTPKAAVSPKVDATNFGNVTILNFTAGVATGSMILTKVEIASIKAAQGSAITPIDYALGVEVSHAANDYFAVTGSSTQTAGVAQTITITMYDAYNNIATAYNGTKSLLFSGAVASLYGVTPTVNSTNFGAATNVVFSNGVASTAPSASMILTNAVSTTVTVTGDGIITAAGLGLTVDVGHNLATNLRIDTQPSTYVRAGDVLAQQPVISIRDVYGNLVDDDATQITASANGTTELVGTRTLTAVDGIVNFSGLSYRTMESITIGFTTNSALTSVTSNSITVDHNKTARFEFTSKPVNNFIIAGGQRGAYTITRYDAYDNLVNNVVNANGTDNTIPETVYLYTSGSTTSPFLSTFHNALAGGSVISSVNIANGATTANFWYYSTKAGEHLITGSDKTSLDSPDQDVINAVHNTLEVRPAALSHFIVSGVGTNVGSGWTEHYYGDRQTVTVEAIDLFGNRKTNYNGTVTFNVTDGLAQVVSNYPSDYIFTVGVNGDNGIHTFENAILFTRPSFMHPSYPTVNEWWVTAVDWDEPSKYGSQVKIKVLARPITITAHNQTKYYYGETHNLGTSAFTVSSGVGINAAVYAGNESISSVQLSSAGTAATATVGNYAIIPSNPTPANNLNLNYYNISYANGTLSVERRPITIATTGTQSKVYGENDPTSFGYSVTSAMGITAWDQWSGVLRREAGENVGFYDMLINGSSLTIVETANPNVNKADNYDISFVNSNQFEITRRPITVNPLANQQKTYGDLNPVYAFTTAANAIGSTLPNGHIVGLSGALTRESGENVGTYKILQGTVDNTENPNYNVSFTEDVLFTINRLPIAVTANTGQTKIYGQLDPSPFGFTANPVIGHELANGILVSLSGTLSRESGEDVGLYAIQQNTINNITNPNYDVSFNSNNFEITRRDIALTPNTGQKKIYGQADPLPFTYTTVPAIDSELANGIQVALSGTLTRDAGEVVALYNLLQGTVNNTTNPNYNISFTSNVKFEIERKDIVINVTGSQSKLYGDNNPVYTYTTTPAVGALPFNAAFVGALVRESGENVASDYTISQGTLELGDDNNAASSLAQNYNVTVNEADFAITRRPITVNPVANQQKTYGDVNPVYNYTTAADAIGSTLPNGHIVGLSGALAREAGENVGTYKILQGNVVNAENPNYDITFTQDVLFSINRLPIAVTANTGQTKIYGQLDPLPFGYTANPAITHELANGILVSLSGTLSRESGEDVGLYAIQQNTINNITNPNYDVSFNSNNFEITRRDIALTPNTGQKKIYGQADPLPFTYTTVPAIDSELDNGIQVALSGTLTRDAGEVVAFYNLLQGTVNNTTNPNYNISFTSNVKFEIERKDIVINVTGSQSKVYGDNNPVYTYTTTPAVGALPFNAAFVGALVRESGENVATDYTISQGTLELGDDNNAASSLAQNYNVTVNEADFAITRKAIAITVTPEQSKVYGEADPVFAFTTIPSLASLPFQAASWTGLLVRETGEVVGNEYTITQGALELIDGQNLSGGSLARNYEVTFTEADFGITRKSITITVNPIAKTYGDIDPAFTFVSSPALISLPFGAEWVGNLVRLNTGENADNYAITQGSLELKDNNNATASLSQNYNVTFTANNLTINKRNITIAVSTDQNKVYAENDPVFTYSSNVDPLYYNGVFTGVLTRAQGENVADNYAIGRGSLQIVDDNNSTSLDANYNLNFVAANFEITKKPITITVLAGQNKRYGFNDPTTNPLAPNYFRGYEFVSSVEPLPFGGNFIGTLQHSGVSSSPVGAYPISRGSLNISDNNNASSSLDANYQITFAGSNFTINERLLTLIASDQTKTYGFGPEWGIGQPDYWTLGSSSFSVSANQGDGLAYSETISGVQFSSTGESRFAFVGDYGISIVAGSAVGSNGFVLSNYAFSYEGAELTVIPRVLNLSNFAADNKEYDGNTVATGLGFSDNRIPGDNLAFTRTADFESVNVGDNKTVVYNSVIISGGVHKDNYVLESNTSHWKTAANRSITRKPLTITANTFTKYFGEAYNFTGTEFTTSEMVTGEAVQSVTLQSDGTPAGAAISSYSIVISNPIAAAGTLLTNYEIVLQNGIMHVVDPMTIAGKVYYYQKFSFVGGNPVRQNLPMHGVTVKLHHAGGVSTTTTNADGQYTFTQINPSTVNKVEVATNLPWGNVSANDALAMQLKLVQTPPTYWASPFNVDFMDYIADVNNSGNLSIQDVLGTKYRILYPNEFTFPAGNWRFFAEDLSFVPLNRESDNSGSLPNPMLTGGFYPNIYARVVGDMDGDYNPNPLKSLIPIQEGEAVVVSSGELFGMDIRIKDVLDFAAMSLTLQFDENKVQVESVSSALSGYEYRIDGNEIRIVWTSLSGLQLSANDLLLTLNMRTIAPVYWYDNILFMNSNTVFGDVVAEMIGNVAIIAPRIDNTVTDLIGFDAEKLSLRAYPNPFSDWVNLSYNVPAHATVSFTLVDLMGVTVKELLDKEHLTGTYTYRFSAKQHNLAMGVYYIRMHVVANGKSYVRIQRLVHVD